MSVKRGVFRNPDLTLESRLFSLRLAIDEYYFSFNDGKARPLKAVSFNSLQAYGWNNPKYRYYEEFVSLEVYKHTGINLSDFMQMPVDEVDFILDKLKLEGLVQAKLKDLLTAETDNGKKTDQLDLVSLEANARRIVRNTYFKQ